MSRLEAKTQSLCTNGPLSSQSIRQSLSVLQGIVMSCYGPSGRLKQVHNGKGGCVLTTSLSSTLLGNFSVTHPALRLLVASVRNHISSFSDCGLFTAILCCNLIDKYLSLNIPPHTVIRISGSLLAMCIDYLNSDGCMCKVTADFGSSQSLLQITYTVLSSKPACMLTIKEAEYVSTLIVQAFLLSIPNGKGASVTLGKSVIVHVEGRSVMESFVVPGLLIEMPEFCWRRLEPSTGLPSTDIKLAVFSVSLSGDFSDTGEGNLCLASDVNPESVMLDQLHVLGERLFSDQVNVLVCQKVIHPSLKQFLKKHNILALERVGAALMEPLSQMTGAKPIASLSSVSTASYGSLRALSKMSHGSKHYVHLIPSDTSVSSIVLCNRNETSLKELTTTCQAAQHILQMTLKKPWVLLGGGCTETHLSAFIRYKSANISSTFLEELNCSSAQYKMVADCFCKSLESVAQSLEHDGGEMLMDLQDGHLWSILPDAASEIGHRCGCRMHRRRDDLRWNVLGSQCSPFNPEITRDKCLLKASHQLILDCFAAKCNGLQVAVDTAGLILDLSYVVEDKN